MTIVTLPDVEAAVLDFLAHDSDVTAARTINSVKGSIGWRAAPPWPCLRVYRVGGAGDLQRLDRALIQLEAIGDPADQTSSMRRALMGLLSTSLAALDQRARWHSIAGVRFSSLATVTTAQWAPEPDTLQMRWFARVQATAYEA